MQWLILLLLCVTGSLILYQDIRSRTVTWFLFPIVALTGVLYSIMHTDSVNAILFNTLINIGFLLFQFLLLKLIFSNQFFNSKKIIGEKIGWGDILLLASCCFFFSPFNFIIFYCLSLFFVLLSHYLLKSFNKKEKYNGSVPMAGLQATFLFFYVGLNQILNHNITTDDWVIFYLMQ